MKIDALFHQGWWPSSNGIPGSLLRMDNLILKKGGGLAVRPPILAIRPSGEVTERCRSIYSGQLSGVKFAIMQFYQGTICAATWGVTGDTPNSSTIASVQAFTDGSAFYDTAFGSYMYQVFCAQGLWRKRWYPGASASNDLPNWGIQTQYDPPNLAAESQVVLTLATCDSGESPAFTAEEGTITATFPSGYDGTANGAIELTPSAAHRSTITKIFSADTDCLNFGSVDGGDADLFDIMVWLAEPENVETITVMLGLKGDSADPFRDDYYYFDFRLGGARQGTVDIKSPSSVAAEVNRIMATSPNISAPVEVSEAPIPDRVPDITNILERLQTGDHIRSRERKDKSYNPGWTHLTVPRGQFNRVGGTTGRDWTTITAIRLVSVAATGTGKVRYDNIRFVGDGQAALTGTFKVKIQPVCNNLPYHDRGQPSEASSEIVLFHQRLTVTIPTATFSALDPNDHVDEFWVYVYGGYLDRYYKAGKITVPGSPADTSLTISKSEAQMLVDNVTLDVCQPPPEQVVAMDGPYKFRMFCLTADGYIYPSQRRRPGTFNYSHAIRVADKAWWIKITTLGVYVGTSKDIYIITGDGEESDGIANFRVDGINVADPPIDACVAAHGNTVFYRAANGFFRIDGSTVSRLPMDRIDDLVARQQDCNGIKAFFKGVGSLTNTNTAIGEVNYRMAVKDDRLYICDGNSAPLNATPGTDYKRVLCHLIGTDQWEYYTFPIPVLCMTTSPDGILVFGSGSANDLGQAMWGVMAFNELGRDDFILQRTAIDEVDGSLFTIPFYALWPPLGNPANYKNLLDLFMEFDCDASDSFDVGLRLDNNNLGNVYESIAPVPTVSALSGVYPTRMYLHHKADQATPPFRTVQPVLSRDTTALVSSSAQNVIINSLSMNVRDRPELRMRVDTGYISLDSRDAIWVREVRALLWSEVNLTIEISFDDDRSGPSFYTTTIVVTPGVTTLYKIPLPKECSGYAARVEIISTGGDKVDRTSYADRTGDENNRFECYWIELKKETTGNDTQKALYRMQPQ
jgi:hypothetical protein